jgi:hypothetical protein
LEQAAAAASWGCFFVCAALQSRPASRESSGQRYEFLSAVNIPDEMNAGLQPLDGLMEACGLKNHDLVAASTAHLTHKEVAKARKGRCLTINTQRRILEALNTCLRARAAEPVKVEAIFNYRGR